MEFVKVRLAPLCAFALGSFCCALASPAAGPDSVRVSTYAGTGVTGISDGSAAGASFLLPYGLAAGRDGTIYVSDETAQRIRAIAGGTVTTVAGSGAVGPLGFAVAGGYRNGPALAAQFDTPLGMAVGPDGALYIADSKNDVIRKLQNGVVSTFAGQPGATVAVDGNASVARFVRPRGLAFDAAGRLWIADFGGGLRCLDHGMLTTVPLTPPTKEVTAVAVQPDDGTVLVASRYSLYNYTPATGVSIAVNSGPASPALAEGNVPFGTPSQMAGIGHGQALFTDVVASNLRYVRFATPPFITGGYTRAIAGGNYERNADNAGFADGTGADARFSSPTGLLVVGNRAFVSDTGNRRIRIVSLPQFRIPESGKNSEYQYDANHYEVALVGPSWTYFDSHDGDSMCAYVEQQLDASGKLTKPARCHTVRIDAGGLAAMEDYVEANLAFRHLDLIVLSSIPSVGSSGGSLAPFRASIAALLDAIKPSHARLTIFWQYYDELISNREQLRDAEVNPAPFEVSPDDLYVRDRPEELRVMGSLDGLAVTQCDSFDAAVAYEKGPGPSLFLPDNDHFTARGNAFYGTLLGECLVKRLLTPK